MDRLFSPWRSRYIASFKSEKRNEEESLFSRIIKEKKDSDNLVLLRKKHCFVMMNLYPYNSGHLMVIPYTETPSLSGLTSKERNELMETIQQMVDILTEVYHPHGFNIGANIGRVAGAGIDNHIHFHIVPRWNGDTNFMPTLGDVKVVSEDMVAAFKKIKSTIQKKKIK